MNMNGSWHYLLKVITQITILMLLFIIFTHVNHTHTENFTWSRHLYKHQIITSSNIKSDSYIMHVLSGGLNCHLFPSVNSCHLPAIAKIVKPLCLKYNIPYNEYTSFFTALYDTFLTVKKLNPKTLGDFNFKIQ